jgi:hypothetical protein
MITTTHIKDIEHGGFEVEINAIKGNEGCHWLSDLYTPSDAHIAGTTIQVPSHLQTRHGHKYYIGQYLPKDLASDYAKQGRENPSEAAYKSLQDELGHYITADTCWLEYVWYRNGIEITTNTGCGFDYSYEFSKGGLEDEAEAFFLDYGPQELAEGLEDAQTALKQMQIALAE